MSDPGTSKRALLLERLFDAAVDLNPDDRAPYLDRHCTDPDLRREVEALLAASDDRASDVRHALAQLPLAPRSTSGPASEPLTGAVLTRYQIQEKLGGGGMGVVYKALDTRLDRTVALKFLPPHLTLDEEAKARFIHEAKAASALDHVNICTVYDIEQTDDGRLFIAMGYYAGETLKAKVARGPLPLAEALSYAVQMARGLARAHEAGIVHRDVKPANVLVTERGEVKIVDFGLAKLSGQTTLTQAGTTLGTVAYMSPEQARGEAVDARTDLWSLGTVMYEMISGQRPFKGDHEQLVVYAILNEDPQALTGLRTGVPIALERVVAKLLMKDRSLRYQSAMEIPADLKAIGLEASGVARMATTMQTRVLPPPVLQPGHGMSWRIAVPMLAAAVLIGSLAVWMLKPTPAPGPVARFSVLLPPTEQLSRTGRHEVALSPDGTRLVYTANGRIYLRTLDQLETSSTLGTVDDAQGLFFSPDGQWVAYEDVSKGWLMKIAVAGGAPVPICEGRGFYGASWGRDDIIVYGRGSSGSNGIWRVSADGGTPEILITPDWLQRERLHWPQVLPGGEAVLFTRLSGDYRDQGQLVVASLSTGQRTVLLDGGTDARYLPTGHVVYAHEEVLLARPFDVDRLTWTGNPVPLVESILQTGSRGAAQYSVSNTGTLVYIPGRRFDEEAGRRLVWVDRQGESIPVTEEKQTYLYPSVSPDGRNIAVEVYESDNNAANIWVFDVTRRVANQLTFGGWNIYPFWTPDGQRVTFSSDRNGNHDIYWRTADRSGEAELLWGGANRQYGSSWSPDGRLLAFVEAHPETSFDLWVLDVEDSTATVFLSTPARERTPMFSPDGKWIAYGSDETGTDEVYVRPYPGPGGQVPISIGGGESPQWSRDGGGLYYLNGGKMMTVPVDVGPPFEAGKPEELFEGRYFIPYLTRQRSRFDVHPDGQRFLMIDVEGTNMPQAQIKVVLNWFEELKQRVPTGK